MHWIFGSEALVQGIWIGKHFRIQQVVQAERRSDYAAGRQWFGRGNHHDDSSSR